MEKQRIFSWWPWKPMTKTTKYYFSVTRYQIFRFSPNSQQYCKILLFRFVVTSTTLLYLSTCTYLIGGGLITLRLRIIIARCIMVFTVWFWNDFVDCFVCIFITDDFFFLFASTYLPNATEALNIALAASMRNYSYLYLYK